RHRLRRIWRRLCAGGAGGERASHPPGGAQCEEVPGGGHQQSARRDSRKEPGRREMSQTFRIAIAGLGTVGGGVMKALAARGPELSRRAGHPLEVVAVSARDKAKARGFPL